MDVACFCGCLFSCAGNSRYVSRLRRVREPQPRFRHGGEAVRTELDLLLAMVPLHMGISRTCWGKRHGA